MNIPLSPEMERALAEEARRRGTTPDLLALDCLRERFLSATPPVDSPAKQTLADFLDGYIAVLSSAELVPGGAGMSENCGKQFAAGLLRKREQGRL